MRALLRAAALLMLLSADWKGFPVETTVGAAVPLPGRIFSFPRDHGSHPEFDLEWWYLTGHLFEADGTRHGFQATFFRRTGARIRSTETPATASFGDGQLFLAHMALSDGASGAFLHQERLNREGWDAASATNTLNVRNGPWTLTFVPDAAGTNFPGPEMELRGSIRADAAFRLTLTPKKPLVVFGTNGVSRKATEPTAASHYLTFPRLEVRGELMLGGHTRPIRGEAWMDHEISSSQLGTGQVGWDWAGIQLLDGREIMAYRMRRSDGATDPFSTLAWVDRKGGVRHFGPTEFHWQPEGEWRSPVSGAVYPARVRVTTVDPESGRQIILMLEPVQPAQEVTGSIGGIAYWEGACRVWNGQGTEIGSAFLEMTGYAASMAGRL